MTEPCVAPRKDGRPCGSVGIIFDPERNGMVCDAHVWPEIKVDVQKRMYGYALQAREALAEQRRAREALMLSLSDHGLNSVLKDLRNFRDGQPLHPKVRKILEGVLRENALRKPYPPRRIRTMSKYNDDFYTGTQEQANALLTKDWGALDLEHLAEEIEALGKSDWRALESHVKNLILHCLKWTYQPQERARRGRGWQTSMDNARDAINQLLRDNHGFQYRIDAGLTWAYPSARRTPAKQTRLSLSIFPEHCECGFDQLMNEDLWV